MTDANLVLGRLLPAYFPSIFGENEDQPLDVEATRIAFEKLTKEVCIMCIINMNALSIDYSSNVLNMHGTVY